MLRLLLPIVVVVATVGSAHAGPDDRNRGRRHDAGQFFMRLSAGFGFNSAAFDDSAETTLRGGGALASLAFGATIAPNIALGVDVFGLSMVQPSIRQNGRDLGDAEGTKASLGAIGLGATFYVMPANIYFAAALGVGVGTLEFEGQFGPFNVRTKEDTDPGLAANLMVGKEWWVSRRWGLGLALQAILASVEADDGTGLGVFGIGLLFSASMN